MMVLAWVLAVCCGRLMDLFFRTAAANCFIFSLPDLSGIATVVFWVAMGLLFAVAFGLLALGAKAIAAGLPFVAVVFAESAAAAAISSLNTAGGAKVAVLLGKRWALTIGIAT